MIRVARHGGLLVSKVTVWAIVPDDTAGRGVRRAAMIGSKVVHSGVGRRRYILNFSFLFHLPLTH
jgi:hypothetical protein